MIRPQRENAAKKQMITKAKAESFRFESCHPFQSNCVFPQIRHLGPTVKILGCLPGDAGSIPAGVAKQNGYGAFV